MQKASLIAFAIGLVVGAAALYVAGPCSRSASKSALVDGKYLVVQSASGHWIYEKGDAGLKLVGKEMSPEGLHAIWELQGSYMPQSLSVGGDTVLSIPSTRYSTETGLFQVVHKIYRRVEGKLVELPMESAPGPDATSPPGMR